MLETYSECTAGMQKDRDGSRTYEYQRAGRRWIKEAIFMIKGKGAYSRLKYESEFTFKGYLLLNPAVESTPLQPRADCQRRRIDTEINPNDIRHVFRSSVMVDKVLIPPIPLLG